MMSNQNETEVGDEAEGEAQISSLPKLGGSWCHLLGFVFQEEWRPRQSGKRVERAFLDLLLTSCI